MLLGIFHIITFHLLFYFILRQSLSLSQVLTGLIDRLTGELQEYKITSMCHCIKLLCGCWRLNLGLHVCVGSSSLTDPSLQPPQRFSSVLPFGFTMCLRSTFLLRNPQMSGYFCGIILNPKSGPVSVLPQTCPHPYMAKSGEHYPRCLLALTLHSLLVLTSPREPLASRLLYFYL